MPIRRTQFTRLRALRGKPTATVTDRSPLEWHAESCSCGSPRRHAADKYASGQTLQLPRMVHDCAIFQTAQTAFRLGAPHVPPSFVISDRDRALSASRNALLDKSRQMCSQKLANVHYPPDDLSRAPRRRSVTPGSSGVVAPVGLDSRR